MDDLDLFPDATPAAPANDDPFPAPRDGATEWVAEAWRDRPSADALTDPGAEMALLGAVMLDYSLLADACARVGRETSATRASPPCSMPSSRSTASPVRPTAAR